MITFIFYCFWTIGKIFIIYSRWEKITKNTVIKSIALGLISLFFMYITRTYLFGIYPFILRDLKPHSLFFQLYTFILFLMPCITDLTTDIVITKLKSPTGFTKDFESQFLLHVYTFPMIALAYEILLIGGMFFVLFLLQ